jgi:hypothetical protein
MVVAVTPTLRSRALSIPTDPTRTDMPQRNRQASEIYTSTVVGRSLIQTSAVSLETTSPTEPLRQRGLEPRRLRVLFWQWQSECLKLQPPMTVSWPAEGDRSGS